MPGSRDKNLRSGDLHEELGIFLLRAIGLVAPVPRQEDVGNDAFATLIRPEGSRKLIPDLSFLVQLKAQSIESVSYTKPDEVAWVTALDTPFFIGRVDLKVAKIELFSTLRLHQAVLEHAYTGFEFLLDPGPEDEIMPDVRRLNLGRPVHAWSIADITEPYFLETAYSVLRPHVETLRINRSLRGIQAQRILQWETGKPPIDGGEMMLISPVHDIADTLRDMGPHVRRLMTELHRRKAYRDFPTILQLFDVMRRWGADPDPTGVTRMMAGCMADATGISVAEAIRIRSAFQPGGQLDLRGLSVTDGDLVAIPNTVRGLALIDVPVTDAGIQTLTSLTQLERLNLTGTGLTDDGLLALTGLPNLEWLCVNRTHVTPNGLASLKARRPDIEVLTESEP
jgi:hypothetical protein